MTSVLDNPAWNALISGNKHLAFGEGPVRYFDRDVSPFVGLEENSEENFRLLANVLPSDRVALFVATSETSFPTELKELHHVRGLQMVYTAADPLNVNHSQLISLTTEHVPQMLCLTKLTNPGPFMDRTIEFGHYQGIFDGDKLVAMAGQRLHAFEYAEVSAVCTHPDHTGRGYARQLLMNQVNRINAAGNIPFLHVRYDNERAIKVYENLGFSTRTEVHFYVLKKA
jgi:ribosomal protein S18 acetylase RimI-like enzyme